MTVYVSPEITEVVRPNALAWLDRHGDHLYRFAMLRLRDAAASERAVQETLLTALKGEAVFDGQGSERTWLVGILRHKILDRLRDLVAFQTFPVSHGVQADFEEDGQWRRASAPVDWHDAPPQPVKQQKFQEVLDRALSSLPARMSAALILREIDGTDIDEICEVLNISRANLRSILHVARMEMRRFLEINWFASANETAAKKPSYVSQPLPNSAAVRFPPNRRLII